MRWTGWVWRGGRWSRVCEGASVGAVARQMNLLVRDVPTHRRRCADDPGEGEGATLNHPYSRRRPQSRAKAAGQFGQRRRGKVP